MADKKLFDLHFEVGITANGNYYARTILGQGFNGVLYREEDVIIPSCVGMTCLSMEQDKMWTMLMTNPQLSSYPFGSAPSVNTQSANKKPAAGQANKQRPSDLGHLTRPQCETECLSVEHFGLSKCSAMCPTKRSP